MSQLGRHAFQSIAEGQFGQSDATAKLDHFGLFQKLPKRGRRLNLIADSDGSAAPSESNSAKRPWFPERGLQDPQETDIAQVQ